MNRVLKPDKLDADPSSSLAAKEWKFWHQTFANFLGELINPDALSILINFVSPRIFEYIENQTTFADAMAVLEALCQAN